MRDAKMLVGGSVAGAEGSSPESREKSFVVEEDRTERKREVREDEEDEEDEE